MPILPAIARQIHGLILSFSLPFLFPLAILPIKDYIPHINIDAGMMKAAGLARVERRVNSSVFNGLMGKMWTYADICGHLWTFADIHMGANGVCDGNSVV